MNNFNSFFRNEGAKKLVDLFFSGADSYTKGKKALTELKFKVEEENFPASYYVENNLTASFRVNLFYTVNYGTEVLTTYFEVPREIDGNFIIDGAYRLGTNYLGNDWDCRINMSKKRNDINFDFNRVYNINTATLTIKRQDPNLGITERNKTYKLDDIDKVHGMERELLRLTDKQTKKLMIKLDLDYTPYYISKQLIEDCIAYGDDKLKDLIIDKTIESVPASFMKYLAGGKDKKYWKVTTKIANYWVKNGKLPNPVNYITSLCKRYFKGSSDQKKGDNSVSISTGLNPINMEALTNRLQIPDSVAYNSTFADLICIGETPINGNVNIQNSLTVSTHIDDNGNVDFDVYDKEFNKITIPYLDYLNQKVVASECVDYENKCLIPDENGQVEVKYRLRRKKVNLNEIDLIDLHPDYRLSETVRQIPFVNYTDSVRIHMGSSMLKQAIGLPEAERPLVGTGNSEEFSNNVLNEKFRYPEGKVKEITSRAVIIELPDKHTVEIPRRTAYKSVNDVYVYTEPKVKVGQTVKKGDIITGGVGLDKDTFKAGLNTLVLFHAMFGYVNEDALVVSESFSKRMCSYSIIDVPFDSKYDESIDWIAPIGTKVKSGDTIITCKKAIRLDEVNKALTEKLGGILDNSSLDIYTRVKEIKVPSNIDEAYVSDVIVQKTFDEYDKNKDRKIIYERYPEYIAADVLRPINDASLKDKGPRVVYSIRVRLIKRTNVMVGSKITNRYGGKGVVSKILPDELMPLVVDKNTGEKKVVEVVMNPYSTINRKIPSVNKMSQKIIESEVVNV